MESAVEKLKIKRFRGVYMRDHLPDRGPLKYESAIVNLDSEKGIGSHWVAYVKKDKNVYYFDSYGNLKPPIELVSYLTRQHNCSIFYNHNNFQSYSSFNCGHLCLKFLYNNT